MIELCKPVIEFEKRYEISNLGRVFKLINTDGKITKEIAHLTKGLDGYYCINLWYKGKYSYKSVHRLVAQAFIPNPNNYPCVNHKDETRDNNNVNNLEWCTYKYNSNYGTCNERRKETRRRTIALQQKQARNS